MIQHLIDRGFGSCFVERLLSKLLLWEKRGVSESFPNNVAKLEGHQIIENIMASIEVLHKTIRYFDEYLYTL